MAETPSIEDIVLQNDKRGVSALRPFLPTDFCTQAARLALDNPGRAIIVTGFYILSGQAPETDGPPGAIAMGRALQQLGFQVWYVSDRYSTFTLEAERERGAQVVEFPIVGEKESVAFAQDLVKKVQPSVLMSIERCSLTKDGTYLNMRGLDIGQYTAKVDYLFRESIPSVGIGDGGNEIGMGNLYDQVRSHPPLPSSPAATRVSQLIVASVSNWGGYGLVAAMSLLRGKDLLFSVEEEASLVRTMVDAGAVEGMSGKRIYGVDGFSLEENSRVVQQLHDLVTAGLRSGGSKTFRGVVASGRGLGVPRMSAAGVPERLERLAGFPIAPGTLNVRLPQPFLARLPHYVSAAELGIKGEAPGFYWGRVVIAGQYPGAVVRPTEPGYPPNLVELVSDRNLRQALGLRDGDTIEFTLLDG